MVPRRARRATGVAGRMVVDGACGHRAAGVVLRQCLTGRPLGCPTADSSGSQPPEETPADSATGMIGCSARGRLPPVVQTGRSFRPVKPLVRGSGAAQNARGGRRLGGSGAGGFGLRPGVPILALPYVIPCETPGEMCL